MNLPEGAVPLESVLPDTHSSTPLGVPEGAIPLDRFEAASAVEQTALENAKYDTQQASAGSSTQQALTQLESFPRAMTFGATDYLAKKMRQGAEALGVPKDKLDIVAPSAERMNAREEANPISSFVGTVGGLATGVGEGALLTKAGKALSAKVVPEVVGEGVLKGMARSAVKLGAENALYQAGDETSKMIRDVPGESVGTAMTNIGFAATLGGLIGGAAKGGSSLWKATVGDRLGTEAANFKARYQEHLSNPDPVGSLTKEMSQYYDGVRGVVSDVWGGARLKDQDIAKAVPEMSPKISESIQDISAKAEQTIQDMVKKKVAPRYIEKFTDEFNTFQDTVRNKTYDSGALFKAADSFKQTLQDYSKGNWGVFAIPSHHEAYDFLMSTKNLAHDIRASLENPDVWGKAAERQLAINKAFALYKPTLDDFQSKFTSEINGKRVIDPGKIQTYLNQLGNPRAELKQEMLKNFFESSENFKKVINDSHTNLGLESPIESTSTHHMEKSWGELTPGARLADMVIKKQGGLFAKTAAGLVGGLAGHLTGIPGAGYVGAGIGHHALGPFLESTIPAFIKPLLEKAPSGEGLRAATEYGAQVVRGQKLATDAVKSVFDKSIKALPDTKRPTPESRTKIKAALEEFQKDPNKLLAGDNQLGHYLPDHAVSMGATITRVLSALQAARPSEAPKTPLDTPRPPSRAQQAQYDRILDIAQQPLVTIESIKDGRLTSKDVIALNTMYPELYQGLRQKLMTEMVSRKSAGDDIMYSHRMGLSLFLGQPLDSTMTPGAIQAAQPKPQQPGNEQQSAKPGGKPSNQAGSTMLKNSKLAQTPTQQSEAMHSTGKA